MKNKYSRLSAIRVIIAGQRISSQDALLQQLLALGYECTQATLSRDLKELEVTKEVVAGGECIYLLPDSPLHPNAEIPYGVQMSGGVVSIAFSANMAVMKTRMGYARGIACDIDQCGFKSVLGTVAGDDTILLVLKTSEKATEIEQQLKQVFGH